MKDKDIISDNGLTEKRNITTKISNGIITILFILVISTIFVSVVPEKFEEIKKVITSDGFTKEYTNLFESNLNNDVPLKNTFIDINGLTHRLFLQREMNEVILLKNGQEYMVMTMEGRSNEGIVANADAIKQFSDWLGNKRISSFYCQVPQKLVESDGQLPAGLEDYSNIVADKFISELEKRGINYFDLRECVSKDNVDRYSLFLKTEHHWKPEGGFYAFQKICEYLRDQFNEDIPEYVTNLGNYNVEMIKKGSLGYYGQRTGWLFDGFDDFSLIYPKWETKQSSWAPHKELLREGTFYDAVFYTEYLNTPWRERGLYGTYIGGDWPIVIHHSETAPINKTIMILIDSFGTIPECFLTTVYKDVIALDLRWVLRKQIEKTTAEFVDEYNPDFVMIMFNPNQIGNADNEQFQYGVPN